ncbi:chitosanase/endoglucanase [Chitinispirillum alkaliphilum]|nr:chitosanase/endoglucanase [Chitinispirillum alkaliphilum]
MVNFTCKRISLLLFFCISNIWSAPQRPFPQAQNFDGRIIQPSQYSQEELNSHVVSIYENQYKGHLKKSRKNGYYIQAGGSGTDDSITNTVSEAHGYGMIIFALMAGHEPLAREYFDGMFYFFKDHPSSVNPYNMSWTVVNNESDKRSTSASDGDMDIAYALLLAHHQWGSDGDIDYLHEARQMITKGILAGNMSPETKRIARGDFQLRWDPDHFSSRSSDWMPGHLRAYHSATDDVFWLEAIDTIYSLVGTITSGFAPNTGLMPDFITDSTPRPDPTGSSNTPHSDEYYYNACRYPWRIATDYIHYGNQDSYNAAYRLMSWLNNTTNGNARNVRAGYSLDGTPLNNWSDIVFTAPFAVAATVDPAFEGFLNSAWDIMRNNTGSGVYATAVNLLSMLMVSGNWWAPESDTGGQRFYQVTVRDGDGSGEYKQGSMVSVSANPFHENKAFLMWKGNTRFLDSPYEHTVSFAMPGQNLSLSAVYIDTLVLKQNFTSLAAWSENADGFGSSALISTAAGGLTAELDLAENPSGDYSWVSAFARAEGTYKNIDTIIITYQSDRSFSLVLNQATLSASGTSHAIELPQARSDTTLFLTPGDFSQPSWTEEPLRMDYPNLDDITGLSLRAEQKGQITTINVKQLLLSGFVSDDVSVSRSINNRHTGASLPLISSAGNQLRISNFPTDLNYGVLSIYSLNGRCIFQKEIHVLGSSYTVNNISLPQGMYIGRITTSKNIVQNRFIVR